MNAFIGPRPIALKDTNRKDKYLAKCLRCRWQNGISHTEGSANSIYDWHMATEHDPVKEQAWRDRGPLPPPGR
jgi:hypothetical protein